MTFWKVSDTRMNCLITEAEIAALGYSLEDLTQDRERTEEFLNLLLKKGKEVLGLNTDNGIQGFYGAFLPDRSLMLSISCQAENSLESIQKDGSEASGMLIEPDSSEKETVRWQILFPVWIMQSTSARSLDTARHQKAVCIKMTVSTT